MTDLPETSGPETTTDPVRARQLLDRDGAAVIDGVGRGEADAAGVAAFVLGPRLMAAGRPIEVTDGGGRDRRRTADAARRMLPLHTDGYAYGAQAPDVFFLVCVTASPGDGGSFLVDQLALLDALADDAAGRELADFVLTHAVDQSEPGGMPAIGPSPMMPTSSRPNTSAWIARAASSSSRAGAASQRGASVLRAASTPNGSAASAAASEPSVATFSAVHTASSRPSR